MYRVCNIDNGLRSTCFTANHEWGECHCKTEVPEGEGFDFKGFEIVDPSVSECGRFFVDPVVYYGEVYIEWKSRREE